MIIRGADVILAGRHPESEGDPRIDTRAAAAHIVDVLWTPASQSVSMRQLRAAVGLSIEHLEDAYAFLLSNPPVEHIAPAARRRVFLHGAAPEQAG